MLDLPTRPTWTDERVDQLKALVADGHSCGSIAKELGGVTRNAVIGKIGRLGLGTPRPVISLERRWAIKSERVSRKRTRQEARNEDVMRGKINRQTLANRKLRAKVMAGEEDIVIEGDGMRDLPAEQSSRAVSLFDAREDQCRWPIGEPASPGFMFCGGGVHKRSYCKGHFDIAYRRVPRHEADASVGRG